MLAFLVAGGASSSFAQKPAEKEAAVKEPAKDAASSEQAPWGSRCVAGARESALDCLVEQKVYVAKTGQLIGAVTIRIPGETKQPVMMIQTPVGLFLPAGVTVDVDSANAEKFELQTCDASGCYVGSPMSKDLLERMQKGQKLNVSFQNLQKKVITLPMALAGFAAAYQKVR